MNTSLMNLASLSPTQTEYFHQSLPRVALLMAKVLLKSHLPPLAKVTRVYFKQ